MELFSFLPAAFLGYKYFDVVTHPRSRVWYKVPQVRINRFQLSPSIRVFVRGRVLHLHHWISCSLLFGVSVYSSGGWIDSSFLKGLFAGGILQGLSTPEARRLLYNMENAWEHFSRDKLRKPFSYPPKKISYKNITSIPSRTAVVKETC